MLIRIVNFYPENVMTLPANKFPKTIESPVMDKRTGRLELLSAIKALFDPTTLFMLLAFASVSRRVFTHIRIYSFISKCLASWRISLATPFLLCKGYKGRATV